jgi:putative addiction module killer protein
MIIKTYKTSTGKEPFSEWYEDLEKGLRATVATRFERIRVGNFGDCKMLKGAGGVWELRIDVGPGYRIYFGKEGKEIVVLLVGGNKGSQERDIEKAKHYWLNYKGLNK